MRIIKYYDRINSKYLDLEVTDEVAKFLLANDKWLRRKQNEFNFRTISLDTVIYSGEDDEITLKETIARDAEETMNCKTCGKRLDFYNLVWKVVGYLDKSKYDLIAKNPYEFMPPIKREKSRMSYYNKDELEELFKFTDNSPLKLIVRVATYYGFRRSELIGLKWDAIDFDNKMITIKHKVLNVNGKFYLSDALKTQASNRTLPLLPEIENLLLKRQEQIEKNKKLYGKSYNYKFVDYVFVDDIGDLINPDHVSNRFRNILKKNKLKHIRFHDLRHSCASLLVANKVPMKNIQEWLGHSNFNTTADVYSHLDYSAKLESASAISNALNFNSNDKENEDNIDEEIEELEKLLEEKKAQKRKKNKDFEM